GRRGSGALWAGAARESSRPTHLDDSGSHEGRPEIEDDSAGGRTRRQMKDWVTEFKAFLLRGNLVDTAVGIVIGLAFAAVISSLVADLITPLIAAIFGKPDFASLSFTINSSVFHYGSFLNALVSFVLVAIVLSCLVVKPVNALRARRESPDPTMRSCPECLSEIPIEAQRCAFCTTELRAA